MKTYPHRIALSTATERPDIKVQPNVACLLRAVIRLRERHDDSRNRVSWIKPKVRNSRRLFD